MNALEIIEMAKSEGLVVDLSPAGQLKAVGDQGAVDRWRPLLKQHKGEIINLLMTGRPGGTTGATRPATPAWCSSCCEHFHKLVVPGTGNLTWCCSESDETHWRRDRLDAMTCCPLDNLEGGNFDK